MEILLENINHVYTMKNIMHVWDKKKSKANLITPNKYKFLICHEINSKGYTC